MPANDNALRVQGVVGDTSHGYRHRVIAVPARAAYQFMFNETPTVRGSL